MVRIKFRPGSQMIIDLAMTLFGGWLIRLGADKARKIRARPRAMPWNRSRLR